MKQRVISIFLAINILAGGISLTGCSKNNNKVKYQKPTSIIETEIQTEEQTVIPTEETISKEILENLKNKIDSVKISYKNEEYYPNEETIKEYKKLIDTHYECKEESTISYPDIYLSMKNNTIEKYGEDNGVFYPSHWKYSKSEKEMYNDFEIAIEEALQHIFSKKNNDYQEDLCSLKGISIKNERLSDNPEGTSHNTLGVFDYQTNTVYIDYESIKESVEKINENRKENLKEEISLVKHLTDIIEHEFNHVRQYPCTHRIKNGDKEDTIGFYNDDITSFIIESSAESGIYNYNSSYEKLENSYYTYTLYRESEALLMLLAAFKENRDLYGYYEAIYDCDVKKFWEYFGLDTDEKLEEFYKIFYAFNTLHGRTKLSKKVYENKDTATRKDLEELVGDSYLLDMMKVIIKDLISTTERNNLSIDDSILLYMITKSYISSEASMILKDEDGSYHTEFNESFARTYKEIEGYYKEYLCNKYNITIEELNDKMMSNNIGTDLFEFERYIKKDYSNISSSMYERISFLEEKYPILSSILKTKLLLVYNTDDLDEYLETIDNGKVMTK